MPETFVLATPEVTPPATTTGYQVVFLSLNWESPEIVIRLRGTNGELRAFVYGGRGPLVSQEDRDAARTMIVALNKANLSTASLHRRILQRLNADGLLAGTINGAPD